MSIIWSISWHIGFYIWNIGVFMYSFRLPLGAWRRVMADKKCLQFLSKCTELHSITAAAIKPLSTYINCLLSTVSLSTRQFFCYLKATPSGRPKHQHPILGITSGFSLKPCYPDPRRHMTKSNHGGKVNYRWFMVRLSLILSHFPLQSLVCLECIITPSSMGAIINLCSQQTMRSVREPAHMILTVSSLIS